MDTTTLPTTADSGYNYGSDIVGLFKYGVGAYFNNQNLQATLENKARYDSINGTLYANGQATGGFAAGGSNYTPLILGAVALLVVVVLINK